MKYSALVAAHQRLTILQLLAEDASYDHNEYVLRSLASEVGHNMSQDTLRAHFAWLAEQGLLVVSDVADVQIAKLTQRGEDAAYGRTLIPGVARPHP